MAGRRSSQSVGRRSPGARQSVRNFALYPLAVASRTPCRIALQSTVACGTPLGLHWPTAPRPPTQKRKSLAGVDLFDCLSSYRAFRYRPGTVYWFLNRDAPPKEGVGAEGQHERQEGPRRARRHRLIIEATIDCCCTDSCWLSSCCSCGRHRLIPTLIQEGRGTHALHIDRQRRPQVPSQLAALLQLVHLFRSCGSHPHALPLLGVGLGRLTLGKHGSKSEQRAGGPSRCARCAPTTFLPFKALRL